MSKSKKLADMTREEILEDLKERWPVEDLIEFNEFNIQERLRNNACLYKQYSDELLRQEYHLSDIREFLEKIEGERYQYYRFEHDEHLQKSEIEKYYLPRDPKVKKVKDVMAKQELKVDYFKLCVRALDKVHWSMKNFLDSMVRV